MTEPRPVGAPFPHPQDRRLRAAVEALSEDQVDALSLDVFDTLLWRRVPDPTDAFLLLGRRLLDSGCLRPGISPGGFLRMRVEAEREARRRHPNQLVPEVTLEQIYEVLPPSLFNGRAVHEMADAEVELERSITHIDPEIAGLVRWARATCGVQVALVSDTYLSEQQLRRLVIREETADLAPDLVITSSSVGRNKGGDVFDLVIERLAVEPSRILHIGDHPHSDVAAPRGRGISCLHYERLPQQLAPALAREAGIRRGQLYRDDVGVHPIEGDFGLTGLRTKIVTARGPDDPELEPYWQFGATVLGPPLVAFAEWVHERAASEGVTSVYPMMREGEFLARLVNATRPAAGGGVHARPLWVSRRVCAEAAIEHADPEELEVFLARRRPPTVREFIELLGLEAGSVASLQGRADVRLDDDAMRSEVLASIAADDRARERIVELSAERRRRILDHIDRTTHGSAEPLILVDLGWGATIQQHLSRIFRIEGREQELIGLYLITTDASIPRWFDDVRSEGFLSTVGHPEDVARWVSRSPEVIEQTFMTDAGSLIGFTADGDTVHAPHTEPLSQRVQRLAAQDGILAYRAFQADMGFGGWRGATDRSSYEDLLRTILLRFVLEPTEHEARLFATWLHDENFGSADQEHLFDDDVGRLMPHLTPDELLRLPMTKVYWPFAVAALEDPPLATAAALVATEKAPPQAFTSVDAMRLGVAIGEGPGSLQLADNLHVASNRNGLRYARVIWREDTTYAELHFGSGPAVVRLDWLRVTYRLRGQEQPESHQFADPSAFTTLGHRMCERPAANLLVGVSATPGLVLPALPAGAVAYEVELEVAFAAFDLSHTPTSAGLRPLADRVKGKLRSLVTDRSGGADG